MSDGSHLNHLGAILWSFAVIRECLYMAEAVEELFFDDCCEISCP
jgi:hypothetical protein